MDAGCRSGSRPHRVRGPVLSRLLLDTTFLIDAERSGDAVEEWIEDDDEATISAVTLAELRVGVLLASNSTRTSRFAFLDKLLDVVPVLEYGNDEAEAHAELLVHVRGQGRRRGAHDLLIAATAKATGRTVVSADLAAVADLPGVQARANR